MKNSIFFLLQDKVADVMKKTQDIIDQMLPKQISNVSNGVKSVKDRAESHDF